MYDRKWVEDYFNNFGMKEWDRLTQSPVHEISLYVHTHYLKNHIQSGSEVLDLGAGAGRFTQILAKLNCSVTVVDVSEIQLELNRKHAKEYGFEDSVRDWLKLDMCSLTEIGDRTFDSVVCFGGPLSYVFEKRVKALEEISRVLRDKGLLLSSVITLWGGIHRYFKGVLGVSPEFNAKIVASGDLCPANWPDAKHRCHFFRAGEFRQLLESSGYEVLQLSASGCLAIQWGEFLTSIRNDKEKWDECLRLELEASRDPGCLDMGTHLIGIAKKCQNPGDGSL